MADAQHDMGPVTHFNTEAVGNPGERRFRILLKAPAGDVMIWLEKEQLHSLAIAIERLLATIASDSSSGSSAAESPAPVAGGVSLDFQSGNWSIGYNETTHTFEFMAHDIEDDDTGPAKVRFLTTLEQSHALSQEALEVYSAGRPTCPLCDAPLNEGETHVCPRGNGHALRQD